MRRPRLVVLRGRALFQVLLAMLFLGGCAALSVDVDVYKGPLANDAHVQVEQVTALTKGAKPLLIQLRDRLELPNDKEREAWQLYSETQAERVRPIYVAGYIPHGNPKLHNEFARQVNGVLSLYVDADYGLPPRLQPLLAEIVNALNDYDSGATVLNPSDQVRKLGEVRWNELEAVLHRYQHCNSQQPDSDGCKLVSLFGGYREYADLAPGARIFRDRRSLTVAVAGLPASAKWNQAEHDRFVRFGNNQNANLFFETLATQAFVEKHAEVLFPKKADEASRREFVELVVTPSQAFIRARLSLQIALERALELLDALFDERQSNLAATERDRAVVALADLISKLARARSVSPIVPELNGREQIRVAIVKEPRPTVQKLKWAHASLLSNQDAASNWESRYGIAAGPVRSAEELSEGELAPSELLSEARTIGSASGLESGRSEEGLERLIEEYTSKRMQLPYATRESDYPPELQDLANEVRLRRDRLFVALVHFAEKVQVIANYSQLVPASGDESDARARQRILQAISTAILSQIDELRKYQVSYEDNVARKDSEARAAAAVWSGSVDSAVTELVRALRADVETAKSEVLVLEKRKAAIEKLVGVATAWAIDATRAREVVVNLVVKDNLKVFGADETPRREIEAIKGGNLGSVQEIHQEIIRLANENVAAAADEKQNALKKVADAEAPSSSAILDSIYADLNAKITSQFSAAPADETKARSALVQLNPTLVDLQLEAWKTLDLKQITVVNMTDIPARWKSFVSDENTIVGQAHAGAQAAVDRLEKSLQLVEVNRGDFLNKLSPDAHAGVNVADAFTSYVAGIGAGGANATTADDRSAAIKDIAAHRGHMPGIPGYAGATWSTDVIEEVIAKLEHERARSLAAGNRKGAEDFAQAAAVMKQRRADQLHIRPPSAFLRNSYPVTAFQQVPPLARDSILWNDIDRLSPKDLATANDIDRQFWQNINHVYVKGGGTSNYAVIRDDVGNFVVKQFSSSPARLIETGRNLARFTMTGVGAAANPLVAEIPDGQAAIDRSIVDVGPIGRQLRMVDKAAVREQLASLKGLAALASSADTDLKTAAAVEPLLVISSSITAQFDRAEIKALLGHAQLDVEQVAAEIVSKAERGGKPPDLGDYNTSKYAAALLSVHENLRKSAATAHSSDSAKRLQSLEKINTALGRPLLDYAELRRAALESLSKDLTLIGAAAGAAD